MTTDNQQDLAAYAIRLGDDSVIHGHRLSEWCSNGPFLEEDLAMTNVALDYIGRARNFLTYAAELTGEGVTEDTLAYDRDCLDYTNLLIYELPRGDFAFTTARQYLLDEFELLFLTALTQSADETLAAIAEKSLKETLYHLRRSKEWMLRLGNGTEESRARLQTALEQLIGYTPELFEMDALEKELAEKGVAVDRASLEQGWRSACDATFAEAGVTLPDVAWRVKGGRTGFHTEHLGHLLSEMQFVQRAYPGCTW
ncbi:MULTISPECIES: 1,2-phenylacetyl-CoA epoxidase subunit PaaC [Spongiibacter]|uniref:Phenylacetate-CoA oxygenase subunit PaaC n=1 Tax=Spongiibacter thalassae TaxID=2721624 RepID=A0ABX1GJM8_9GAMM|nr:MULTISPECIES: 1,2-phenylacetyl-CoA epoxidase subunit PaaC [Spongiibacter]MBO6754360.1 phenylacetate-CoA oxygenase subunit PaaC [Spongiibacter sp.]NKI18603.1 phenylacetate-CoA oxygenase subunit PaaC [Spongiibacter thalassae]|tara:strand:+ start:15553 stop:16317 length:765 start_codon:yes stop_codon:yes gene_type:complete